MKVPIWATLVLKKGKHIPVSILIQKQGCMGINTGLFCNEVSIFFQTITRRPVSPGLGQQWQDNRLHQDSPTTAGVSFYTENMTA